MNEQKQPFISKSLFLIALSHLITDLSQGALPILLPFFKNAFDLSYTQIGFIVLAQNFTSSVIQPIFGYVTDRHALPWLVPAGLLLSGLGMAATGFASSYAFLLMIVIFTGLGIAAFHPQASKASHFVSAAGLRGRSMAVFSVGGNLGNAIGSVFMMMLLTLPGVLNNTMYFCLPAIVLSVVVWLNLPRITPPVRKRAAGGMKGVDRRPFPFAHMVVLLAFIFLRSSIAAGLLAYIPLYYADYLGGSHVYASYLLSVFSVSGVVGTLVGGTLSDRIGRKTVIVGSMVLVFPLLCLFQYTSGPLTMLLTAATGFILVSSFSTATVLAQEMMPGYEASAASLSIGFSIGMGGIGVTLLGYVADHFNVPMVFTVISLIPVGGFVLASFLPGRLFQRDHVAVRPDLP
jgi:FSR family fosmidomycin resistance protein-like MFS transporter